MKPLRSYEAKVFERVNPLVGFSVSRYVLAVGLFVAVFAFGVVSTVGLGVDLLPAINIPAVVVRTIYPGATPGVIDEQVTQVIENSVSTLAGITDINSNSAIGVSRVVVTFDAATDKNADANQVATVVSTAIRNLPAGISPPTIQTFDPNSAPILQFGISGEGANLADVNDYVTNTLIPNLQRVDGVANVSVDGAPSKQFEVLLNPDRLRYYGLTPQQVVSAITTSALNMPIGTIVKNNNALTFSTQNTPADLDGIQRTLVDPARGISVTDVGSVRATPTAGNFVRVNGNPEVLVSIQRTTDSNSVAVADAVRGMLKRTSLPAGYLLTFSNDTTSAVRASVNATYHELFVTALVVAIIVLLFLGRLNTAFAVILAIPIALSAAPVLYSLSGFTFNLVSLLALIIAIGIVVDDSIVVAENVTRYRAMGLGLKDSVLRGASEVFSAVVAASLSLLSVLLPVSFIPGFIGSYLRQFSLGLAAAVAFSLLEALLFLTVRLAYTPEASAEVGILRSLSMVRESFRWGFSAWRKPLGIFHGLGLVVLILLLRKVAWLPAVIALPVVLSIEHYLLRLLQAIVTPLHNATEAALGWVRDRYANILGGVMKNGGWILAGAAVFLVAIVALVAPHIPFSFVPTTDAGTLQVSLRYPAGTPIAVTNEGAGRIEKFLFQQPEVESVQTLVGGSNTGVGGIFSSTNSSNIVVQLVPITRRPGVFALIGSYRGQLLGRFRDQPQAQIFVSAGGGFGNFGSSLQLAIVAPDFATLQDRNNRIVQNLQTNPWVVDVSSGLSDTTLENDFIPDPSRLKGTGITPAAIATALQTYASGVQASNVMSGGLSYPIQVQADPTTLSGSQSLLNLPIYSPTLQSTLQIGQLGSFSLNQAPVSIGRYNRQYTGGLTINLKPDAPPALAMQEQLTAQLTAAGLIGGGVSLTTNQRFNPAALAAQLATSGPLIFLLALFLAYLVMAAQFNSWRYPVYLLLPVPLALVGALVLVYFMGGGLDIFGLMGMLMLIGLSAKNAILYLDFVVERIGKMPFKDALIEAGKLRFRPIVMTTMTVLVISFPLIFGRGEGSEYGQRMGIVMFGGIMMSAILTFFVVPAAFYLFERRRVEKREAEEDRVAVAAREA
ncbi:MAG TPA: efflux RND transporter permease subunit [Spirochaetia bacterium]|nr:efflux RND transporter permease subunit [Spirochaetia bacterium]